MSNAKGEVCSLTLGQGMRTNVMSDETVFLLSPARCDGRRAQVVLNPNATFDLATRLREPAGASLGAVVRR